MFGKEVVVSKIKCLKSTATRGHRSNLISFYCDACHKIHIDHKLSDVMIFENFMMCRQSFDEAVRDCVLKEEKSC